MTSKYASVSHVVATANGILVPNNAVLLGILIQVAMTQFDAATDRFVVTISSRESPGVGGAPVQVDNILAVLEYAAAGSGGAPVFIPMNFRFAAAQTIYVSRVLTGNSNFIAHCILYFE